MIGSYEGENRGNPYKKEKDFKCHLLPHTPYSPNLAPSDYWLFGSNEEVMAKTDDNFKSKVT